MSAAIFSKWGRIERGLPVTVTPDELDRVTVRDFIDIAKDTGLQISIKRIKRGFYRLRVVA